MDRENIKTLKILKMFSMLFLLIIYIVKDWYRLLMDPYRILIIAILAFSGVIFYLLKDKEQISFDNELANIVYDYLDETIIMIGIIDLTFYYLVPYIYAILYMAIFFVEHGIRNVKKLGISRVSFYNIRIISSYALVIASYIIPILTILFLFVLLVINCVYLYIFYKETKSWNIIN